MTRPEESTGVVETLRAYTQSDRIVELVFADFDRLHRGQNGLIQNVAKLLAFVSVDPILMHLKQIVGFVRPRAFPVERGPRSLQFVED